MEPKIWVLAHDHETVFQQEKKAVPTTICLCQPLTPIAVDADVEVMLYSNPTEGTVHSPLLLSEPNLIIDKRFQL